MKKKIIPVELEGDEMFETPDGQVAKVKGASHAKGGVDMNLPEGTKVYSDKLKIGGKTMAERKEARMKKMMDILKKADSNTKIGKRTGDRMMKSLMMEEQTDMAFQESLNGNSNKFSSGGLVGLEKFRVGPKDPFELDLTGIGEGVEPITWKTDNVGKIDPIKTNLEPIATGAETPSMGMTAGDIVGLAGQAVGQISQMANTIANAKATKKNINYWLGFNDKALQSNAEELDNINYNKATAMRDLGRKLALSRNSARATARGSASSINTLRNLDLGVDTAADEAMINANNQIESNAGSLRGQVMNQRTQLLSQKDQAVMAGEERRDLADRQDLDAMFSNFSENFAGISNATQNFGKSLNESKYRNDFLNILPQLNKWGIGMDANGNLTQTGPASTPSSSNQKSFDGTKIEPTLDIDEIIMPEFDTRLKKLETPNEYELYNNAYYG